MFDLDKYIKKPEHIKIKMFNASLEDYKRQFDSKVFRFKKNTYVEVPLDLVETIYDAMMDFGVFPIFPEMTKDDTKQAHRDAFLKYLNGGMRQTIRAYQTQEDQAKREGVTLQKANRFERLLKWREQLIAMLNKDAPIEEELNFEDFSFDKFAEENSDMFSRQAFAQATVETPEMRAAREKAASKVSAFENIDLGNIAQ